MRLSRTYRAILVFLFVGFLGATGPALDGENPSADVPQLIVWMDYETRALILEASDGMPGAPGAFSFIVTNGPTPGTLNVPFTFDAIGNCTLSFPLQILNNGSDLAIGIQLLTLAPDSTIQQSPVWALTSHNYLVEDPMGPPPCPTCPTSPGGWIDWVNWPGVQGGPLYPHCEVAIPADEPRPSGSQPMLVLESGPAGSFPIN
jgi:hypothetical protein